MTLEELFALGGIKESGLEQIIKESQKLLRIQNFYTAGPTEARAWTIPIGTKAREAAGNIHTDMAKGFIRAEIISYQDYLQHESEEAARNAGKARSEGPNYIMQDGDVAHFRFNV